MTLRFRFRKCLCVVSAVLLVCLSAVVPVSSLLQFTIFGTPPQPLTVIVFLRFFVSLPPSPSLSLSLSLFSLSLSLSSLSLPLSLCLSVSLSLYLSLSLSVCLFRSLPLSRSVFLRFLFQPGLCRHRRIDACRIQEFCVANSRNYESGLPS